MSNSMTVNKTVIWGCKWLACTNFFKISHKYHVE